MPWNAVSARAADLYMPDLMRIGGVTGWLRAAAIAAAAGLLLSSHLYPSVSVQLLRVSGTADWQWSDWAAPILAEPLAVRDGYATVPDAPGSRLAWDESGGEEILALNRCASVQYRCRCYW